MKPADSFINLTGHQVVIYDHGRPALRLPAEERGARIGHAEQVPVPAAPGVDVVTVTLVAPALPDRREGVWLIVPQVTALSLALLNIHRPDVVFPGPQISDRGRVVGCRGLRRIPTPLPPEARAAV